MATAAAETPGRESGDRSIRALFEDTRRRLVETGTRNRLVHVNRANTRGNVIAIVNERSDDVFAILSARKSMRFKAIGRDRDEDTGGIRLADAGEEDFDPARYSDAQLETRIGPDALQKRLLKIVREARTAEEEQGVNILYLALGFLTWFEDQNSAIPREAPLVLLPVELVRNQRSSTYDLRLRDDDLVTNLPLQQRLQMDFGIRLPELELDEGWTPSRYFEAVEAVIGDRGRWKIDRDGMQLGFFSFSKLLMYLDLAPEAWPDNMLEEHKLARGLLFEGFDPEPSAIPPEAKLDEVLPPARLFHVVDADASQARVIEEARAGRNLVVQGPPGTGKSQTITNIIAAAAQEGKSVLFVAEKMAALSVVHDRLVRSGLRDICLELHSKSTNKKAVLQELARTLGAAHAAQPAPPGPEALTEARDRLNAIAEALHASIPGAGESAFDALSRQIRCIGRGVPPPRFDAPWLAEIDRSEARTLGAMLRDYGMLLGESRAGEHPFAGTGNLDMQPVDLARLKPELEQAAIAVERLDAATINAASALDLAVERTPEQATLLAALLAVLARMPAIEPETAERLLRAADKPRLVEALGTGAAWRSLRDDLDQMFVEAAYDVPSTSLRAPLAAGATSFFARWGGAYRTASRQLAGLLKAPLPRSAADRLALVDRLGEAQRLRARLGEDESFCAEQLSGSWRGERTDFARLHAAALWVQDVAASPLRPEPAHVAALAADTARLSTLATELGAALPTAREGLAGIVGTLALPPFDGALDASAARLARMATEIDRYPEWVRRARLRRRLDEASLGPIADRIEAGELDGEGAADEFAFARAERLWKRAVEAEPLLHDLQMLDRHELAGMFAKLERARLRENAAAITARHLAQVPQGAMGEMKVVRGEIGKRTRHMALRRLFSTAPTAIQRIKPVLLMSPISVAQFLPPGALTFDLLVIDEASQVRPEDALGAIARARQIVVVGDQKQLPPTSFFDRLLADGGEEEPEEEEAGGAELLGGAAKLGALESILSLCEARGLGGRMLEWHYRSRDPSLIRVSNREFYRDKLILPPSPFQGDPAFGLCFTRVEGVYDRGGKRDNRKEGEAIVARVAEHARAHPTQSLGIVTFSSAQRNLITELLELARRDDLALDTFLAEGKAEDVFVKNIENVQGDERDVILVSVGYGPSSPGGKLGSMSFGPINGEGGERRLNVLFTRARIRCEVFASFDPADIDVSRTAREGPRILKRFLEFAKTGAMPDAAPSGEGADTPFEEDVADAIRSLGYLADPQVGSAGFRIDLGVRHPDRPGKYLLAVECDGAAYHSALWARERDRLRQDVLEQLGWKFHRIWSTDWFYNRRAEIERLKQALDEAHQAAAHGIKVEGANRGRAAPAPPEADPPAIVLPEPVERVMPPYRRFQQRVSSHVEPHEADWRVLTQLAARIVEEEGPIHVEEAARRIAACFGKEKAGARILAATQQALRRAAAGNAELRSDGPFWFTRAQADAPPVRDRSAEQGATLKAGMISMLEIVAALRIAREDNGGGGEADLIRGAARLLGFRRVGPDLQARLSEGVALLD